MGKVYIGQTRLKIEVDLKADVTGATVKLKYRKPAGTEGEFTMAVTDATSGIANYEPVSNETFNEVGTWTFWAHVTYGDGKVAAGEPFNIHFYKEGK